MNTNNNIIAVFTALSIAFLGGTAILQEKTKMPPVSMNANAAETYGDLNYIVGNNGTIKITDCDKSVTEIIIPNEINGIPVTSIEKDAFRHCNKLESITMPNSIISIGNFAFYVCSSLTSITIPDSVTNIGFEAFGVCSNLTSIKLSQNIITIDGYAFSGCKTLTSVIIPDSVTNMGNAVFTNCDNLASVKLSDNVNKIGCFAFKNCKSLKSITIPESVTNIEEYAFSGCTSLDEITILNPKCNIYDSIDTISETATICGYENSTAQKYAEKYNYKFQSLGEIPKESTIATTSTTTTSSTSRTNTQTETGTRGTEGYWSTGTQTNIHSTHSNSNNNTGTTTTTTANNDKLLGDINGDGLIDSVDATLIMSYYAYVSAYEGNGEPDTFSEYLDKYLNK